MKAVLLHVREDSGLDSRLRAALDMVRHFDGHLTCLQATPFDSYIIGDPFGGVYAFPEVVARVRETEDGTRARVEAELGREGVAWDWINVDGAAAQALIARGRLADAIVASQPVRDGGAGQPLPLAADVALHARAPVLSVPAGDGRLDCGGVAVIAWNGSPEAALALRLVRPMLRAASSVHLISVGEGQGELPSTLACRYLSGHGIHAELRRVSDEAGVAEALASAVAELGAAYLVMGAYGHSRLRELVLGGVTQSLIHDSPVPLLIAH